MTVLWRARTQLSVVSAFSLVWIAFIAFPAAVRYLGVESVAKERFYIATVIVNLVLLVGVLARWSRRGRRMEGRLSRVRGSVAPVGTSLPAWFWFLLSISLGLFLIHAVSMPQIPLLELIRRGDISANELTVMREQANKLLPLPLPVKYLFYWNVRVLIPILIATSLITGRRSVQWALLPLLLGLSTMTLEKSLPTFAVIAAGIALAAYCRTSMLSRPLSVSLFVSFLILSGLQIAVKYRDVQAGISGRRLQQAEAKDQSPTAVLQELDQNGDGAVSSIEFVTFPFRFLQHRVLTGPSDVAYAWFEYFPDVSGGFLRGQSWSPRARLDPNFRHPANLVGIYAYHSRDPGHYLESAHAYAAFHADAWANFGYPGVAMGAVLVVALLMLTDAALVSGVTPLTAGAAGSAASILITTLPGGGLQAALVAQGLVLALPLALVPLWIRRRPR